VLLFLSRVATVDFAAFFTKNAIGLWEKERRDDELLKTLPAHQVL
jgi:hypothetical protein